MSKAFAVTWDSGYKNLMVATTSGGLDDAKAAVDTARANAGVAVESSDDLNLSGPSLVGLYAALAALAEVPPPYPTRFENRTAGQKRVFALLEENFKTAPEAAAPSTSDASAAQSGGDANNVEGDDVANKGKKAKRAPKKSAQKKAVVKKAKRAPAEKKARAYKPTVVSKGGEKAKATALEMIQRAHGATAEEIKDRLDVSLGTAKNLVWYLRRDGHKIVVNKASERRPYIIEG